MWSRAASTISQNNAAATERQLPDYTTWTNADLIQRVTELEIKLRAQNNKHNISVSSNASPVPPMKKPKKPSKHFDPSKYSTRYIALKFAYLGKRYNGFEYHSNNSTPLPTVEEELWRALRKTRLIFPNFREGQSEDDICWDGCEYSKCGRTDRGVSAFGQVIGLRVRSSRPIERSVDVPVEDGGGLQDAAMHKANSEESIQDLTILEPRAEDPWDPIKDELPYIQVLNRVLPEDIRVLAWCPNPPPEFSARFSCKERRYRYFFTDPAYAPVPGEDQDAVDGRAWLDVEAMQQAAKKLEGLHDFRNFCKIDPSKQISTFERRIFHATIEPLNQDQEPGAFLTKPPYGLSSNAINTKCSDQARTYFFEVHGSAFLWHQVRHMIAILFLVGQGYEDPSVVDDLLDIHKTPARPIYEMASDTPLVLWECIFPDLAQVKGSDHEFGRFSGYEDSLEWVYAGDLAGAIQGPQRKSTGVEDRKYGRLSIMEDLWGMWRKAKMDETLGGLLMDLVAQQGKAPSRAIEPDRLKSGDVSARVFDGSETPRTVGPYVPIMERERMETPKVVNARYATRKGWSRANAEALDVNE